MRRLISLTMLLVSGFAFAGGGGAPPKTDLKTTACHLDLPSGFQEGRDVTCAFLSVPERYDVASSKTFKLFVVRLHPSGHVLLPDPVIYLHGGPGGNIENTVSSLGAAFSKAAGGREVVFFDQRGSGRSTGQLDCPLPPSAAQGNDQRRQDAYLMSADAYKQCRAHLLKGGTDLKAYSSAQIAGDIERLRTALGAAQLNLYGLSYGTRVAQEVMRRFPTHVRSVILDSPVVAGWEKKLAPAFSRTLRSGFALCRADAGCQTTYGDLEGQLPAFLKQLDQQPPELSVLDAGTGNVYSVQLTSNLFLYALFKLMYQASSPYSLPSVLNPAMHGSYDSLLPFIRKLNETKTHFSPVGALIDCADQQDALKHLEGNDEAVLPEVQRWGELDDQLAQDACAAMNLDPQSPGMNLGKINVPALILTGGLDPITPPIQGEVLKRMLAHATLVQFPMNGHGQVLSSDPDACAFQLLKGFWSNPSARLDSHCAAGAVSAK